MDNKIQFSPERLHYLQLLSTQYPTVQAASTRIIKLQTVLNLPKGTEHFMSDIHGEYDAFLHILNSCSGEVKEKIKEVFGTTLSSKERNDLATLIYYPKAKLELVADQEEDLQDYARRSSHQRARVLYLYEQRQRRCARRRQRDGFRRERGQGGYHRHIR